MARTCKRVSGSANTDLKKMRDFKMDVQCNKVVIELVISNGTRAARSFDFELTQMISDQIALHSVQLQIWGVRSMGRGGVVVGSEW